MCGLHAVLLICKTEAGPSCSLLCCHKPQVQLQRGCLPNALTQLLQEGLLPLRFSLGENKNSGALTVQENLLQERVRLVTGTMLGNMQHSAFTVVFFKACGVAQRYFTTVQWQQ